jgi:hypothetical protein
VKAADLVVTVQTSVSEKRFLSCTGKFIESNMRRIKNDKSEKIRKKAARLTSGFAYTSKGLL